MTKEIEQNFNEEKQKHNALSKIKDNSKLL